MQQKQHTWTQTRTDTQTRSHTDTQTHTDTQSHRHGNTHKCMRARTNARTHNTIHAHKTHTHIHTRTTHRPEQYSRAHTHGQANSNTQTARTCRLTKQDLILRPLLELLHHPTKTSCAKDSKKNGSSPRSPLHLILGKHPNVNAPSRLRLSRWCNNSRRAPNFFKH